MCFRYPATHTGKGKKLSGSVFYWVIQKQILRVYVDQSVPVYMSISSSVDWSVLINNKRNQWFHLNTNPAL